MPTIHLHWNFPLSSLFKYRAIHRNSNLSHNFKPQHIPNCFNPQHCISTHIQTNVEDYYYSALQRCANIKQLLQTHAQMHIFGLHRRISLAIKLVNKYVEYRNLSNARQVFDKMSQRYNAGQVFDRMCEQNILLWNAMLAGYASYGLPEETMALYYQMQVEGIQPDEFTFSIALKACTNLSALQEGKKIQCYIVKRMGLEPGVFVVTGLVDMYIKCGSIENARQVFDKMPERNVVSWTALIRGYVQSGQGAEALKTFNLMRPGEAIPNAFTVVNVLSACTQLGALQQGKWIHAYVIRSGFDSDFFIGTTLVDMYASCDSILDACQVFDKISTRDVVSWTSMIGACAQNGYAHEALALFKDMQFADVKPNPVTLLSVVMACANLGNLQHGRCIHSYVLRHEFQEDESVGNALVSMYAKHGSIEVACTLFQKMPRRNVVSWNAMIAGYAQNGYHSTKWIS